MDEALVFFGGKGRSPGLFISKQGGEKGLSGYSFTLKAYPENIRIKHEIEALGFPVSVHPLDMYRYVQARVPHVKARDIPEHKGKLITTIGWMITGKTVLTLNREPMKFVTFEDTTGIYESVLFPDTYRRFCHVLGRSVPYVIKGYVEEEFGVVTLNVRWLSILKGDN